PVRRVGDRRPQRPRPDQRSGRVVVPPWSNSPTPIAGGGAVRRSVRGVCVRELTYTSTQIAHPEWVDGRRLWLDPEVRDVVTRLRDGDPTRGWEGDPRLALYFIPGSRQWELMRLEADGEYRTVARSKPGARLTPA